MLPQLIAREEAKAAILRYIEGALSQDECYWEPASRIKKCAILTTAGIKGTGKTRVFHEMCTSWLRETGAKAALTVDFNGGSYWDHSKPATEVFSKLLLQQSGMPADKAENCARVLPWKQVMQCLREKLNLGDEDLLLVAVGDPGWQRQGWATNIRPHGSPGRVPPPNKQLPGNLRVDIPA